MAYPKELPADYESRVSKEGIALREAAVEWATHVNDGPSNSEYDWPSFRRWERLRDAARVLRDMERRRDGPRRIQKVKSEPRAAADAALIVAAVREASGIALSVMLRMLSSREE